VVRHRPPVPCPVSRGEVRSGVQLVRADEQVARRSNPAEGAAVTYRMAPTIGTTRRRRRGCAASGASSRRRLRCSRGSSGSSPGGVHVFRLAECRRTADVFSTTASVQLVDGQQDPQGGGHRRPPAHGHSVTQRAGSWAARHVAGAVIYRRVEGSLAPSHKQASDRAQAPNESGGTDRGGEIGKFAWQGSATRPRRRSRAHHAARGMRRRPIWAQN
jgi:hypothetical protein